MPTYCGGLRLSQIAMVVAGCFTISGIVGCDSSSPFDYVKVSGKATYEDGTPIPSDSVIVTFIPLVPPIDEVFHARPAFASPDSDGTFSSVTSYKPGDGLVPGEHKVIVTIRGSNYSQGFDNNSKKKQPDLIPKLYRDPKTTPLTVNTDDSPFDIKIERQKQ